jgi:3-carboxy-cis,cis-muconate cycloisomerase
MLASLAKRALETQEGLMKELGPAQPVMPWHTIRDTIAESGCFLGLVTGTLGKLSMDVKLMMQTEVAEVYEPFAPGRGSSSTMRRSAIDLVPLYPRLRRHRAPAHRGAARRDGRRPRALDRSLRESRVSRSIPGASARTSTSPTAWWFPKR